MFENTSNCNNSNSNSKTITAATTTTATTATAATRTITNGKLVLKRCSSYHYRWNSCFCEICTLFTA